MAVSTVTPLLWTMWLWRTGQPLEEGHVEKLMKLQNQGRRLFSQDFKEQIVRIGSLSAVGKRDSVSVVVQTSCHQKRLFPCNPSSYDLETHYMKLSKNWAVNLCGMGPPESGVF